MIIFQILPKMDHELGIAALTIFSILIWYSWISKTSTPPSPPLPPGPRGLPLLGYLPFLSPNLHHQFTQLSHKYGPVYKLWLGSKLHVIITSPLLLKQVVRDHDSVFANRDPPVAALVATGGLNIAWSSNGPYWRDMRKLFAREMLSNSNLQASYVLRKQEVRRLVRKLNLKIGEQVEIGELIFLTELNVILSLLWGGKMDEDELDRLGAEFHEKVSIFVDLIGRPNVSDFFPGLARFDIQGIEKEMRGVLPGVDRILDSVIDVRMKTAVETKTDDGGGDRRRKDFLGILLELKEQQVGEFSFFGLTQIKAILVDIIIGGTDTTATIVEWAMAELLHRPDVMQKVQQEVTHVVGANNIVEESHLSKLHYLDAVVKETFRLHPPLPFLIPRSPSESCTIGGYTIPKGSRIFLNTWSVHMDPQVWDNPSEFRPERFLNGDEVGERFDYMGNNFGYLPFGSGRRVCPGLPLAEKMVMYLVATLVHSFDWRLPEGEKIMDLSEKFGIIMRKRTPLVAIPYNRRLQQNMDLYA